jgi:predicted metalloprotease with PDZ domain
MATGILVWNDLRQSRRPRRRRDSATMKSTMTRSPFYLAAFLAFSAAAISAAAQNPLRDPVDAVELRFARSQPVIAYTLRIAPGDLAGFDVEIRIRNAPDTIRLAMAAHPEYDDRFWRYVSGVTATTPRGSATVAKVDTAVWRVIAPGGEATVRYRIQLPAPQGQPGQRGAWRPFLSPTGALAGGPHAFMYVLGETLAPVHVKFDVPSDWDIATGLEPTSDPRVFFAPTADILIDSPVLTGRLRSWRFFVDGVPHRVVYWPLPNATPFDTTAFVGGIERLAKQAIAVFGRAPYREYTFMFQDDAYGGLEHFNSVTLGAPSADLAQDPFGTLEETAHEYFHGWNLMRIRPAERGGLDYRPAGRSRGLWFSEGLSIYYADLLLRRANVARRDTTRIDHVRSIMRRYFNNRGSVSVAPESASLHAYDPQPGGLGDYAPSVHNQGEIIGTILDIIVRDATDGRRSIDDVMRLMLERYSGQRGFTGRDIERTVADVCNCSVKAFFDAHVRGSTPIDFNRYLRLIGLSSRVAWAPAVDTAGQQQPDYRISAWDPPGEQAIGEGQLNLQVTDPNSVWARAGLHTGDRLLSVNGKPMKTWPDFRGLLRSMRVGDRLDFQTIQRGRPFRTTVVVEGYQRPTVTVEQVAGATERQRRLRERWLAGMP